ncbi:outer membrane lipoprotein chaperone LolA [Hydrogenovibrio marinus]|uniref:Outer-membrane lipoprotein carrier protein n=1 Tax=Hydrogenovibrio marinus TaxID=28885 RepID=A0A066ZXI7_HYDMR|nr:outer membrane lipoprotein chaperone LolA [Hydrogenovibrio marinus]KDN94815.1 cell envelope biogenesis protein LolA [Hydrogenovibrio marinus]BBN59273.1 outer-membrane lipoprotein carrier protein [Hydrogenovibrio marinus]
MKKQFLTWLGFIVLVASSWQALAESPKSKIETLHHFLENLHTFKANFIQTQPDEQLFQENKSTGYVVLSRPGKLIWVYKKPDRQEIISDSLNLWVFEPDIDQVTVRPLTSVQSDFPLRWLLYNDNIESNFNVLPESIKDGISWYNLTPKDSTFFQSLEVAIKGDKLVQIWMYQSMDNITKVKFTDIQQNVNIASNQFDFSPPEGVDVIGQQVNNLK